VTAIAVHTHHSRSPWSLLTWLIALVNAVEALLFEADPPRHARRELCPAAVVAIEAWDRVMLMDTVEMPAVSAVDVAFRAGVR
jgi:hypothetical protein